MYRWHRWFLSVCESLELRMLTLPNTQSTLHTGMVSCWTKALARLLWAERHECPHVDEVWGYGMVWVQDARFSFVKDNSFYMSTYILMLLFKVYLPLALPRLRSWAIRPGTVLWLSDLLAMPCHALSANVGRGQRQVERSELGQQGHSDEGHVAPIFLTSFSGRKWAELDNIGWWQVIKLDNIGVTFCGCKKWPRASRISRAGLFSTSDQTRPGCHHALATNVYRYMYMYICILPTWQNWWRFLLGFTTVSLFF